MKAFLFSLLSATLALAPTIGLAQTSKCDASDSSCKSYKVTYTISSGPIYGNLTVNSRRLKGWRWRTPSKILYASDHIISEFCTLVDSVNDEEWSYVFEDSEGRSHNFLNIYTDEINEGFDEQVSFTASGVNRREDIDFNVSFSRCPEGPQRTYYGPNH